MWTMLSLSVRGFDGATESSDTVRPMQLREERRPPRVSRVALSGVGAIRNMRQREARVEPGREPALPGA